MKLRNGFVSNSSSSSFILGYGEIVDMRKFKKFLKDNEIILDPYNMKIQKKGTKITCEYDKRLTGGNNTDLLLPPNIIDGKVNAFIVDIGHNEGDHDFTIYDDNGDYVEMDYEPAFRKEFYSAKEQKIIDVFKDTKLIKNGNVIFGAERNG